MREIQSSGRNRNIRRPLLHTAGGKVLLAALPEAELDSFLRSRRKDEQDDVHSFLEMLPSIRDTGIAVNIAEAGSRREWRRC